jgi:uncharacterized membrane protein
VAFIDACKLTSVAGGGGCGGYFPSACKQHLSYQHQIKPDSHVLHCFAKQRDTVTDRCRLQMTVRFLRTTEPTNVMVFYLMVCTLVFSVVACAITHKQLIVPTSRWDIGLLIGQGLFGYGNQVCITKGLANARAASVMCMQYLSIVISQLAGMLLFGEFTSWVGDAGMILIVLSMVVYMRIESDRKARR